MKNNYLFILLISLPGFIYGQDNQVIKSFSNSVDASFSRTNEELNLGLKRTSANNDRLTIKEILLENGNLLIGYDLANFRPSEKKMNIALKPTLLFGDGEKIYAHPKYIEGTTTSSYNDETRQLQIIWHDFQENFRFSADSFQIKMEGQLIGLPPIDCNVIPEFGTKQRLPHYIIAGAGVGLVISGFVLDESHKQLYDDYKNLVFEGDVEAETKYNKANTRNKLGGFLKNTGYIVFGVNAIVYGVRYLAFNRKKKDYEYYCKTSKLSMLPYFENNAFNTSLGMQVAYQF